MTRRLAVVRASPSDAGPVALRALAEALAPYMRELLGAEARAGELVDVASTVPASRRSLYAACRRGEIVGAVRVARRWLAPRDALEGWLRQRGPRLAAERDDDDDLEPLRRRLAGARR